MLSFCVSSTNDTACSPTDSSMAYVEEQIEHEAWVVYVRWADASEEDVVTQNVGGYGAPDDQIGGAGTQFIEDVIQKPSTYG